MSYERDEAARVQAGTEAMIQMRQPPRELEPWEKRHLEAKRQLLNYRGRRLRACNAAEDLVAIIEALGVEDGSQLPPVDATLPAPPSAQQKAELQNTVATLLRTILIWNDGQVSPQRLPRF